MPHTGGMDSPGSGQAGTGQPERSGNGQPERSGTGQPQAVPLPGRLSAALAAFGRHLAAERGLSPHTVRAYLGDVGSLLEHAAGAAVNSPDQLDIGVLRRWLASQYRTGHTRATLARRAAAARTFTAWACARGLLATDPGPMLGTPRARRRLPQVPRQDQMAAVLAKPGGGGSRGGPAGHGTGAALALRDTAIMELLYATGIRVSELCGLDIDDLDPQRHTIRVLGKGGRERTVPAGVPAMRAVEAWRRAGRPAVAAQRSGPAPRKSAGAAWTRAPHAGWCMPGSPRCPVCPIPARTACGTRPRRTCWRVAPICAACRNSWGMPRWRAPRSTRTSRSNG